MQKDRRVSILFSIVFAFLFGNPARAELHGELENPFRYFRYPSDYAVQRMAFDTELKRLQTVDRSKVEIAQIEQTLQSREFWNRQLDAAEKASLRWPKSWTGNTPLQIIEGLRKAEGRKPIRQMVPLSDLSALEAIERFGWGALLDTHLGPASAGVCWNRTDLLHNNCTNYVKPKSWRVRVFDDASATGNCKWQLNAGAKFSGKDTRETTESCDEIYVELDAVADVADDLRAPSGRTKILRTNAQGAQTPLDINLNDRLIIGIGIPIIGRRQSDRPVVLTFTIVASSAFLPVGPPITRYGLRNGSIGPAIVRYIPGNSGRLFIRRLSTR